MRENVKAGLHAVYHFWKPFRTYEVNGEWAGGECACGATFGTAKEWHQFLTSLDREKP